MFPPTRANRGGSGLSRSFLRPLRLGRLELAVRTTHPSVRLKLRVHLTTCFFPAVCCSTSTSPGLADSLLSSHLNSPLPHPLLHSLKTVTPDSSAVVQCTPFNKKLMNRRTHREIQSAPNRRITVASLSLHQGALQRWSVFKEETAAKNEQILCELLRVNRPECGTFKRLIQ